MTIEAYQEALLAFVRRELLKGKADDLTVDTPLLELGIIDSFSIFAVLAFIESELGVTISPESLEAGQLASVRAIAKTVAETQSTSGGG